MVRLGMGLWLCWLTALAGRAGETVSIKGSNTFGEFLGPQLMEAFRRENPRVTFDLERKGTATGVAALIAGECDLGAASRMLSQDEWRLARSRGLRLKAYTVGYYGVAVIVNELNPVRSLSDRQVRDLFTGTVTNWRAVGGGAGAVRPFVRDDSSGTRVGFQELAMGNQPYPAGATGCRTDADIAKAVAADPQGVGYVGMHLLKERGVHPVAVNGVPPTTVAINEGLYPYARLILLYANPARLAEPARQFLRFVQSRRGQQIVEQHGYVPATGRRLGPAAGTFN